MASSGISFNLSPTGANTGNGIGQGIDVNSGNFCFRAQRGLSPSLPIVPQHRGFDTTATPA